MTGHADAERLSSYLDNELGHDEAGRLAEHLETCDSCRAQLEGLRRVMGDLRNLGDTVPPAGLGLRIQQHLAREAPPYHDKRGVLGHRVPQVLFQPAVLASLAVILALGVIMVMFTQVLVRGTEADFPGGPSVTDVSPLNGEQVEINGRLFELMSGHWFEADLTVAEVTEARAVRRSELLAEAGDDPTTRAILERLQREVTMRLGDETVRVSATAD